MKQKHALGVPESADRLAIREALRQAEELVRTLRAALGEDAEPVDDEIDTETIPVKSVQSQRRWFNRKIDALDLPAEDDDEGEAPDAFDVDPTDDPEQITPEADDDDMPVSVEPRKTVARPTGPRVSARLRGSVMKLLKKLRPDEEELVYTAEWEMHQINDYLNIRIRPALLKRTYRALTKARKHFPENRRVQELWDEWEKYYQEDYDEQVVAKKIITKIIKLVKGSRPTDTDDDL